MELLIILIITEILTVVVLQQHFYTSSKAIYFISIIIHVILSLGVWIIYIETISFRSFYDSPRHVWLMMNLACMIIAVVIPRAILDILHFSGKIIRIKKGDHLRYLTNTGLIIMIVIMAVIGISTFYGRFNFKKEEVTIKIKGLNSDLDGLRIVQISDLHLPCFYNHRKLLQKVMYEIDSLKPDLLLNTGDFIDFGWREFDRNDTILSKARSKYGNYAILGNHDAGTYDPFFTEGDRDNNILIMNNLITASGYKVLNDEFKIVNIGKARIALIGIITKGHHPHMIHGDLKKAISGLDSVDLKILLSHDPNQWEEDVTGKTDIDITLSGHTHGMQMGIITKKFRWSPSKYFYPHWNGLYSDGNQYQYVNRGLGVLAIPFRIWMPPEITIITIKKE
ncbi:MAG: metallophosphoesterase [Bacteroidales bacterium]